MADLVSQQIAAQINQTAEESALLSAFRTFPSNIPAADQQQLKHEAETAYRDQFVPAWRKLHACMAGTYTQHVRPADTLSSVPNGRAAYAILVRRRTTTD